MNLVTTNVHAVMHPPPAHVTSNGGKPGAKPIHIPQFVSVAPRLNERFLNQIFGRISVTRERRTEPNETWILLAEHGGEAL
jgi:hypothetical protein